jgi:two-component system chemotaxis response regulator CheB
VYLAPQNYHLLLEMEHCFSLDYSEPVHFSRPSIDVTMESAARVYGAACTGILLSGANQDGALGLQAIRQCGGLAIAQDPDTAEYPVMPLAALDIMPDLQVMTPEEMIRLLIALNQ